MSTAAASARPTQPATQSQSSSSICPLQLDQYHAMIGAGVLTDDTQVELLEGWLTTKMSKNPRHRLATWLIRQAFERVVPDDFYVDSQEPITTDQSEPEPDVMLVRGTPRLYRTRHPGGNDVALVVEVSDSTLERDRTVKSRVYASAGIPVYWIVNLVDEVIEEFSGPDRASSTYRVSHVYRRSDTIAVVIAGVKCGELTVNDVLA